MQRCTCIILQCTYCIVYMYFKCKYTFYLCHFHYVQSLEPCSENFPIENYTINVNNSRGFPLPPSTLPPPGNIISMEINDRNIPLLQRDMVYSLSIIACSNFSCKQSKSVLFCKCNSHICIIIYTHNLKYLLLRAYA